MIIPHNTKRTGFRLFLLSYLREISQDSIVYFQKMVEITKISNFTIILFFAVPTPCLFE